jgi:hypothetical protein
MVEGHRHLDQALEEVAGRTPDARPQVLEGVVALEEVAAVELVDPLRERAALFGTEERLGDLGHDGFLTPIL